VRSAGTPPRRAARCARSSVSKIIVTQLGSSGGCRPGVRDASEAAPRFAHAAPRLAGIGRMQTRTAVASFAEHGDVGPLECRLPVGEMVQMTARAGSVSCECSGGLPRATGRESRSKDGGRAARRPVRGPPAACPIRPSVGDRPRLERRSGSVRNRSAGDPESPLLRASAFVAAKCARRTLGLAWESRPDDDGERGSVISARTSTLEGGGLTSGPRASHAPILPPRQRQIRVAAVLAAAQDATIDDVR